MWKNKKPKKKKKRKEKINKSFENLKKVTKKTPDFFNLHVLEIETNFFGLKKHKDICKHFFLLLLLCSIYQVLVKNNVAFQVDALVCTKYEAMFI